MGIKNKGALKGYRVMKKKMEKLESSGPKFTGIIMLFGSSIVLSVGISAYLTRKDHISFLISLGIWLIGTIYSIKYLNRATVREINYSER